MQPLDLKPGELKRLDIPFAGGLVSNRELDRIAIGQLSVCQNLWRKDGLLLRRPCVKRIATTGLPSHIYGLYRYYRDGTSYSLVIGEASADATTLALYVRKNDSEATEPTVTFSEQDVLFDTATWRIVSFAQLREVLALADGVNPCRFISEIDPTTLAPTTGRLGYLKPADPPYISTAEFGSNQDDSPIEHGIYRIGVAWVFKETGEHSNPGPLSNVFDCQFLGRSEDGLGVKSLYLTGVSTGYDLNEVLPDSSVTTQDQDRVDARSFPGQFKKFADDLFGPVVQREEAAGFGNSHHTSTDGFDGGEAVADNDLPPTCEKLIELGRDTLAAIGCKADAVPKPKRLVAGSPSYYADIPTTKTIMIKVANQTARTVTRAPVLISIDFSDLDDYADVTAGHDFVFADTDGVTILPYIQDDYTAYDSVDFWVQIPEIPASGVAVIYLHYDAPATLVSLEKTWNYVFEPELTDRDDLVHFRMDESDLSAKPINRRTNLGLTVRDYFIAYTRFSQSGDPTAPPYNFDTGMDHAAGTQPYLYQAHMRTEEVGILATPKHISVSCMVKIGTYSGSGTLYVCGLAREFGELDTGAHLACTSAGDLKLRQAAHTSSTTYGTLSLPSTGLKNGNWWFIGCARTQTSATSFSLLLYAADMTTGDVYTTTVTGTNLGMPFQVDENNEALWWHICDPNLNSTYDSTTQNSVIHVANFRASLRALSSDEFAQLARRKPALAETPTVTLVELEDPDDDAAARRIRFSRQGDPHAWPYDSEHTIEYAGDKGGFVTAAPFLNGLVAWHRHGISLYRLDAHRAVWTREDSFNPLAETLGIAGRHTLAVGTIHPNEGSVECAYFLGSDARVHALLPDGSIQHLSEPVDDQFAALSANGRATAILAFDPRNRVLVVAYKTGSFAPAGTGPYGENAIVMQADKFDRFADEYGVAHAWPQWRTWLDTTYGWRFAGAVLYDAPGDSGQLVWFTDSATAAANLYTLSETIHQDQWFNGASTTPTVRADSGFVPFEQLASIITARPAYFMQEQASWISLSLSVVLRHPLTRETRSALAAAVASLARTTLARASIGDAVLVRLTGSSSTGAYAIRQVELEARGMPLGAAATLKAFGGGGS